MALSVTCALVALITPQLTLGLTLNKIKKTLESPVLHAKHSLSILNFVCVWWGLRWIFFFDQPHCFQVFNFKGKQPLSGLFDGASENHQYPFTHGR